MIRPALSLILGAAFLISAAACSSPASSPTNSATPSTATPTPAESPASASPSPSAPDVFAAMTAATTAVPGTVVEVGRDREGTVAVWEIGVRNGSTGTEVYVNRETGAVIRQRPLVLSREQRQDAAVTAEQAIRTAQADTPGELMELDLGTERGRLVWEVLVRESAARSWEFYVDAQNGKILRRQRD